MCYFPHCLLKSFETENTNFNPFCANFLRLLKSFETEGSFSSKWVKYPFKTFHGGGPCHIETSPLICWANQWTGFYMVGITVMKELIHPIFLLNLQLSITRGEFRLLQNHLYHYVPTCYFRHGVTKAFSFDKQNNTVRRVGFLIHIRSILHSNRNQSTDLHCKPIDCFLHKRTIDLI